MKNLFIWICLIFSALSYAQIPNTEISIAQSSSSLEWNEIENKYVRIIYPNYLHAQAQYVANLINYYHIYEGAIYDIPEPEQVDLIIRSEYSVSNGFVTLGPRRTEWYSSANLSPIIGALDWYQSLAVHEYRHVLQMDFLNQGVNKWMYYLFGDFGRNIARLLTVDSWFMEGDAVWAETAFSNAGRGRSPRFSARLRALLSSGMKYSYDDYLMGRYDNILPHLYIYGYYSITGARRKFGDDIWTKVVGDASDSFPHFYRFYNSFEQKTGQEFDKFFEENFEQLASEWKSTTQAKDFVEYQKYSWPMSDQGKLYVLKSTLKKYNALYLVEGNQETKLHEFDANINTSKVDLKNGKFAYTQLLPDIRYGFKGSSDLFVYDINEDELNKISSGKRYYHPSFSPDGKHIIVTHFDELNEWSLRILDTRGNIVDDIETQGFFVSEAIFLTKDKLAVIAQTDLGMKNIQILDLKTKKYKALLPMTRSNIYALSLHNNEIYFEADYDGRVELLRVDKSAQRIDKCSKANIAQYQPRVHMNKLYSVDESVNGFELKSEPIKCSTLPANALDKYNYLSKNNPSDQFIDKKPLEMPADKVKELSTANLTQKDYSQTRDLFNVHSWSYIGLNGVNLSLMSNNFLGDFSAAASVVNTSSNNTEGGSVALSYSKFFPIFTLKYDYMEKDEEDLNLVNAGITETTEVKGALEVTLPFMWRFGFYDSTLRLRVGAEYIKNSDTLYSNYNVSEEPLDATYAGIEFSYIKRPLYQQIVSQLGFSFSSVYKDANADETEAFSNYYWFNDVKLYLPGLHINHSLVLNALSHRHSNDLNAYRFNLVGRDLVANVLSRGYDYSFAPDIDKYSLNYVFPISFHTFGFRDWIYFNRVRGAAFYDYTSLKELSFQQKDYRRSYGVELSLDSLTFRKIPITYSVRLLNRVDPRPNEDEFAAEFFLGVEL